jgi:hypothetical protein
MRGWRRWLVLALAALLVVVGVGYGVLAASTSRSQLARAIVWGESDVDDHRRARLARSGLPPRCHCDTSRVVGASTSGGGFP